MRLVTNYGSTKMSSQATIVGPGDPPEALRTAGDGRLIVEGRRDSMFISGGEEIHPEEIERELREQPAFAHHFSRERI